MIDNRNRTFHYAVLASLALHALLLFAFPDLLDTARRVASLPPQIIARLMVPEPAPAPPVPEKPAAAPETPPARKPEAPKPRVAKPLPKPEAPAVREMSPEPAAPSRAPEPPAPAAPPVAALEPQPAACCPAIARAIGRAVPGAGRRKRCRATNTACS